MKKPRFSRDAMQTYSNHLTMQTSDWMFWLRTRLNKIWLKELKELKELVLGMNEEDRRMKIRELERKPETTSTAQPLMK